jgi:hypothetical protein
MTQGKILARSHWWIRVEWHQVEASVQEIGVLARARHRLKETSRIEFG